MAKRTLLERIETERDQWMETAAAESRNTAYYRGLLDEVAAYLGPEVFISDDGTVNENPLRSKIPELVARLAASNVTCTVEVNVTRHGK
jgi:hypothetical protein